MTRSQLEQRFLAIIDRHGLPRPKVNTLIEGYEVDFAWPEAKLIVETDGFAAHGTRKAFESDRLRDRRLGRVGFHTMPADAAIAGLSRRDRRRRGGLTQPLARLVEAAEPGKHLVGQRQVVRAQIGCVVQDRDSALG